MPETERGEWLKCSRSLPYFLDSYCMVFNPQQRNWVQFRLWPAQVIVADALVEHRQFVILKARQLGMSWLCLGFALWLMLFRPAATVLLFSRRDDEAIDLLDFRLKGIYQRLPTWMQARAVTASNTHEWKLSNNSMAYAFPTTGGDSYTASLVIVDEADLIPNLSNLLGRVEPTIAAGGRIVLLSRADKDQPASPFKRLYLAAKTGQSDYRATFLPWSARPDRSPAWYAQQRANILAADGSLDRLHEQFPATDAEALAARSLDKRIPAQWLSPCDHTHLVTLSPPPLVIPGLTLFSIAHTPTTVGVDPAEGNPHSDESAAIWVEVSTGRQIAVLAGRFEPSAFAGYIADLAPHLQTAGALVERNNHGHAVIQWLRDNSLVDLLPGPDDKPGYLTNARGKAELWRNAAEILRDEQPGIHDSETYTQIASIEGSTLRAPNNMHDDRAMAWALAQWARALAGQGQAQAIAPVDPLDGLGETW